MNTVLIIQARMGSSRLPNKVLKKICDKPMLEHILKRTLQSKKVEHVMVATTLNEEDKQIDELCHKIGIDCFCGIRAKSIGLKEVCIIFFASINLKNLK